jgi:hypothetical protein
VTSAVSAPDDERTKPPGAGDGHDGGHGIHMPSPSYFPLVVAAGLPCLGYAAVFREILWLIPGVVLVLFGVYAWGLEPPTAEPATRTTAATGVRP